MRSSRFARIAGVWFPAAWLCLMVAGLGLPRPAFADGVMFSRLPLGQAADLVSSPKQEAILITDGLQVTVILRTHFQRGPEEVAWIVPVPGRPTHIGTRSDDLFARLDAETTPRFELMQFHSGPSFGCAATAIREPVTPTVRREASGTAGIYSYDVLTARSATDLTAWLTNHHYTVPPQTPAALEPYVIRNYHFLAMRLRPEAAALPTVAPHPVTYTYTAASLVYPMIISKVSAAPANEIILYVLGPDRYTSANWTNASLEDLPITQAPDAPSGTSYERQLQRLTARDSHLFVTEFARNLDNVRDRPLLHDLLNITGDSRADYSTPCLTRLRALITPAAMDRDVSLVPALAGRDVNNVRILEEPPQRGTLTSPGLWVTGSSAAALYSLLRRQARRRSSRLAARLAPIAALAALAALTML